MRKPSKCELYVIAKEISMSSRDPPCCFGEEGGGGGGGSNWHETSVTGVGHLISVTQQTPHPSPVPHCTDEGCT